MVQTAVPSAPEKSSTKLADVQYHSMDYTEWRDALQGVWVPKGEPGRKVAWLQMPRLRYYLPGWGVLRKEENTQRFFACTAPNPDKEGPARVVVGLLEIDFEGNRSTVGLKYVTVDNDYKCLGVATTLYKMLIAHLKVNNLRLYRTRPGKDTPEQFTSSITKLLDHNRIDWYRSEY